MAAQFTLTNLPVEKKEEAWMYCASTPFPVPFSPWIRIGPSVFTIFSTFCRMEDMAAERPKIISWGGNPPPFGDGKFFDGSKTAIQAPLGPRLEVLELEQCTRRTKPHSLKAGTANA